MHSAGHRTRGTEGAYASHSVTAEVSPTRDECLSRRLSRVCVADHPRVAACAAFMGCSLRLVVSALPSVLRRERTAAMP